MKKIILLIYLALLSCNSPANTDPSVPVQYDTVVPVDDKIFDDTIAPTDKPMDSAHYSKIYSVDTVYFSDGTVAMVVSGFDDSIYYNKIEVLSGRRSQSQIVIDSH